MIFDGTWEKAFYRVCYSQHESNYFTLTALNDVGESRKRSLHMVLLQLQ